MFKPKFLLLFVLALLIVSGAMVYFCNKAIADTSQGKLYSDVDAIPYNKAGLLLGTSKYLANGMVNPYYKYRIMAAVKLVRAGKIRVLIISGDNSRKTYNEPEEMKQDVVAAGVDSNIVYLDYAGFRTFDSMVRLKEIFSQDSVTVISQPFHNERAIYIASNEGIAAIGFNAKDVGSKFGFTTQVRERLARVKVFIDHLTGKKPHFLGPKVPVA